MFKNILLKIFFKDTFVKSVRGLLHRPLRPRPFQGLKGRYASVYEACYTGR